jgi:Co/Zn/Cd efflux system component
MAEQNRTDHASLPMSRTTMIAGCTSAVLMIAGGLLLWWREGEKLFTDGLITALMRCF